MWGGGGELERETAGEGRANCTVKGYYRSRGRGDQAALLIQAQDLGPGACSAAELSAASALCMHLRRLPPSLRAIQHVCSRPGWGRVPYQQGVSK